MRNDTKLGVLVGLAIVVVASVYFYGNGQEQGDLLVTSTSERPELPQIPISTDDPAIFQPASTGDAIGPASGPGMGAPSRRPWPGSLGGERRVDSTASPDGGVRSTYPGLPNAIGGPDRRTADSRGSPEPRSNSPSAQPRPGVLETTPGTETVPRPADRVASTDPRRGWSPIGRPATPLRTRASDALSAAARANLQGADRPTDDGPAAGRRDGLAVAALDRVDEAARSRESARRDASDSDRSRGESGRSVGEWPKRYRVRPGETLYGIAQVYYGSGVHASAILRANPAIKSARRLREDTVITLPDPATLRGASRPARPSNAARRTYLVRKDDSFYLIAKRVLGDGRRWHDIYELNKTLVKNNPKRLKPGMRIALPPK